MVVVASERAPFSLLRGKKLVIWTGRGRTHKGGKDDVGAMCSRRQCEAGRRGEKDVEEQAKNNPFPVRSVFYRGVESPPPSNVGCDGGKEDKKVFLRFLLTDGDKNILLLPR